MIKSKDLPMLFLLVGVSVLISFFASNFLFGKVGSRVTKVELVDPISADFNYTDKAYYLPNPKDPTLTPINPTKDITVSENNNTKPLGQ